MSLNVKVKVPVTVTGNKVHQQNQLRVAELPQAEYEIQDSLDNLDQQALEEAREEAFQQGILLGWLEMEHYLGALGFAQPERGGLLGRKNCRNQQPHGLLGGWAGLGWIGLWPECKLRTAFPRSELQQSSLIKTGSRLHQQTWSAASSASGGAKQSRSTVQ
jgi:hypothetical protein